MSDQYYNVVIRVKAPSKEEAVAEAMKSPRKPPSQRDAIYVELLAEDNRVANVWAMTGRCAGCGIPEFDYNLSRRDPETDEVDPCLSLLVGERK